MRCSLLYLAFFCCAATCWGAPPYSCSTLGSTWVYYWNETWRDSGNLIYSYAATAIDGDWSTQWQLYQSTWLYKDQTFLGSWLNQTEGPGGVAVEVYYWRYLNHSSNGPGTYRLDSFHTAYAAACNEWAPPYWNQWDGNATSSLTVERPTIWRSDPPPHYLGGSLMSGNYTAQSVIYSDPKGAPETPQFILSEGPGDDYGELSCTNCWYPVYTAVKASTGCLEYNVTIRASYDGFESDLLWIFNNAPASLEEWGWHDFLLRPYGWGWETHRRYKVLNMCGEVMDWPEVNEWFTNAMAVWTGWTDWPLSWAPGVWDGKVGNQSTPYPGKFNFWAEFDDIMYEVNDPPGKTPQALQTGSNGRAEDPDSTVTCHQQYFKAGTTSTSNGVTVKGPFKQYHYLDHGDHKPGACP